MYTHRKEFMRAIFDSGGQPTLPIESLKPPKIINEVIPWNDPEKHLLVDEKDRFLGNWNRFGKIIKKYMREANLPDSFTPHTLRDTYATHLVLAGERMEAVSQLLGHSSVKTTEMFYVHLTSKDYKVKKLPY